MLKIVGTSFQDVLVLEPNIIGDERGFFLESWNERVFRDIGLDVHFVQDNHSRSAKGVLRGLHFQNPNAQGKLVRVVAGRAWDVVVDLRHSSSTFGRWASAELSAANKRMLWVPPGFAHGFLALEDNTDFLYKCTDFFDPQSEHRLLWDDPEIGIDWPLEGLELVLSGQDRAGQRLRDIKTFA